MVSVNEAVVTGDRGNIAERSATGEAVADRRGQLSWALFEFARSPYLSLIYIFVFGPYFATTVIGDPVRGQELWSIANTVVGIIVAVVAPILGAISDRTGGRKPWIVAIVLVMAPCCIALWYAMPGGVGGLPVNLILLIIVTLACCFLLSEVFHNAMLPSIVGSARIGSLSGLGIAANNMGSLIVLSIMLLGVAFPASEMVSWEFLPERPLFGLDPALHEHNRIAGPVAGFWLLLFTLPLLLFTPDRAATGVAPGEAIREGFNQLRLTIKQARRIKNVGLYLLARMLYNDGKVAILAYSGIYAAGVFRWELPELLLCALMLTPFSISGGFIGGWLDNKFGSKRAITISISSTIIGLIGAVSITPHQLFFLIDYESGAHAPLWSFPYFQTLPEILYIVMFMALSVTVTAAFTNSRTMMARIAPLSMMNQFYGLYALSGTATAFLGHACVGLFTRLFNSQRVGLASTAMLLIAGLMLMFWVREERAEEISDVV